DLDLVDPESRGGKLTLHELVDGHAAFDDQLARLVEAEQREHDAGNGEDSLDQLLVQYPGVIDPHQHFVGRTRHHGRDMTRIDRSGIRKTLRPYLLQLASSTIQATSSSNECPACWACSGASEVSVMPGWV